MIDNYEKGIPNKYQKSNSTKARHNAKLYSMLDFIYRWGFTTTSVLEILWDVDRSVVNRLVKRYVADGVLTEVATFACRDKRVFLIKPKAVRMLEELHSEKLKYTVKPSTLNFKTITHDLMVSAVVAYGIQQNKYSFFITETEQLKDSKGKRRRFDAICFERETNLLIGIELEASSKSIPHRLDILKRYKVALENSTVHKILMISHKRRFIVDAERVHKKITDKTDNKLDSDFFKENIKYIYNREIINILYHKFWLM